MTGKIDDRAKLESFVADALERSQTERVSWLEELGRQDPDLADRVRECLEQLEDRGLSLDSRGGMSQEHRRCGRFELRELVGSGGMGEVWIADDGTTPVAVKLLRPDLLWFEGARKRFQREIRAVTDLDHPGLVKILEFGVEEGMPWMAMEWIEGQSLEQVLQRLRRRAPSTLTTMDIPGSSHFAGQSYAQVVCELLARVAGALAYAHEKGIVHRDVKPSNILLRSSGQPVLIDFGLARSRASSRLTRTGSWIGSLPYAAPEQLEGSKDLDGRADVYALGATLYECLTLQTPFLGGSEERVRARIASGALASIRSIHPAVPRALERVCRKAMDTDPRRRYASAATLADDLYRVAAGAPAEARPVPLWLRCSRTARRNSKLVTSLAFAAIVLSVVTVWAVREHNMRVRIQRMADAEAIRRLEQEAETFAPPTAVKLPEMDRWLLRAENLLSRRAIHAATLKQWHEQSLPYDSVLLESDQARAREDLLAMRLEVEGLHHYFQSRTQTVDRPQPIGPDHVQELTARWHKEIRDQPAVFLEGFRRRTEETQSAVQGETRLAEIERLEVAEFERRRSELASELLVRRSFRFADEFDQWRHDSLAELIERLDEFGEFVARVRQLRSHAETKAGLEPVTREAWQEAERSIAISPIYRGMTIVPRHDLQPLRPNPVTGLWEFLAVGSGEPPRPDPTVEDPAKLAVTGETGVIFVLLPGGSFSMGLPGDATGPQHSTARPRHPVELAPFYISKYELTVAQGKRLGLSLPADSHYQEAGPSTWPVRLDWQQAAELLIAHGFEHPTEAQWEYAARAGGDPSESMKDGRIPLDPRFANCGGNSPKLAGVGSFLPNEFGLYDCLGNLSEWCREWFIGRGYCTLPARPGDGLMETVLKGPGHVLRGGSYNDVTVECDVFQRTLGTSLLGPTTGSRPILSFDVPRNR